MPVESLVYSIPYVLLIMYFTLLVVTEYTIEKQGNNLLVNRQIIRLASISALLFFFGLRGFVGWDWYMYYPAFNDIPSLLRFDAGLSESTRFEQGFAVLMAAVKAIWNNYHFFIFVNTLIDILILNVIIKRYSRYSFSFSCMIFIIMGGFYLETDLLRSAKSMMLFLLSLKYIQERRIVPYFLYIIAACLFHISSVIYLPLYFILDKKIPRKVVIIIFIIGLIIFLLQLEYIRFLLDWIISISNNRFGELIEKYLHISIYLTGYGITIGLFERIITSSLLIIYYEKLIQKNSFYLLFINIYIIYFIIFFYFAEIKIIPIRVGGLFSSAYWILFPALFSLIKNRNNKIIFLTSFFLYSFIKITGMTDNVLYRYVNVMFGSDDFISRVKIFESSSELLLK